MGVRARTPRAVLSEAGSSVIDPTRTYRAHDQEGTLLRYRAVARRPVSGPMAMGLQGLAFNDTWTVLSVYRSTIRVVRRYASVSQASMSRSAGKEGLLFFLD